MTNKTSSHIFSMKNNLAKSNFALRSLALSVNIVVPSIVNPQQEMEFLENSLLLTNEEVTGRLSELVGSSKCAPISESVTKEFKELWESDSLDGSDIRDFCGRHNISEIDRKTCIEMLKKLLEDKPIERFFAVVEAHPQIMEWENIPFGNWILHKLTGYKPKESQLKEAIRFLNSSKASAHCNFLHGEEYLKKIEKRIKKRYADDHTIITTTLPLLEPAYDEHVKDAYIQAVQGDNEPIKNYVLRKKPDFKKYIGK